MKPIKLLVLLLALLMAATSVVACKNESERPSTDTSEKDTTAPEVDDFAMLGIPENTDFAGDEIVLYNQPWQGYAPLDIADIEVVEGKNDVISQATYSRNFAVEEKLNCIITVTTGEETWQNGLQHLQTVLAADCPYDVLMIRAKQYLSLMSAGYLTEIQNIPYLNLEEEWWDMKSYNALALNNKAYAICSDMTTNDDLNIFNIYFNKDMIEDQGLESPYDLVDEGKWTLDAMYQMGKQVAAHPDGPAVPDNGPQDIYGFGYIQDASVALLNAFNVKICSLNEEGVPEFTMKGDIPVSKMQKLFQVLEDTKTSINFHARRKETATVEETQTFLEGRELFCIGGLYYANEMRTSETEFGIIPLPKYDEEQAEYSAPTVGTALTVAAVPASNKELDKTGIFMEYFCYMGNQTLRPALYDSLLEGYLPRDEESLDMLNIIFDSVQYDTGLIFNFNGVVDRIFTNYNDLKSSTVSSDVAVWKIGVDNAIKALMQTLG